MKKLENWQKALKGKWIFKKALNTFYYTKYNTSSLETQELDQGYDSDLGYNPMVNIKAGVDELLIAKWVQGKLSIEAYSGTGNSEDFLVRIDESLNPLYEVPPVSVSDNIEVRWGYGKKHKDTNEAISYFIKLIKTFDKP